MFTAEPNQKVEKQNLSKKRELFPNLKREQLFPNNEKEWFETASKRTQK